MKFEIRRIKEEMTVGLDIDNKILTLQGVTRPELKPFFFMNIYVNMETDAFMYPNSGIMIKSGIPIYPIPDQFIPFFKDVKTINVEVIIAYFKG
jgi:hypothetical protein